MHIFWQKALLIDPSVRTTTLDHNLLLLFISSLQLRSLDSVAFFGAEAKGSNDEQAAFSPGGALADAVLVAYPAAAQKQHMVCVAQPLVARLLPPKDCKRKREKKHKKESDSLQAINLVLWRSMCCLIELSVSTDGLTWGQEEYHEQQGEAQC